MARRRNDQREIEWHFFSFPVAFAFCCGAFLATLLIPVAFVVFVVSLFGVSFGVAHIIGHQFRRRSRERARLREEEEERERRALAARATNSREGTAAAANTARRRRRRR